MRLVRAANPGPMTLTGTNTWVVGDPREVSPVVVDPGPADDRHLAAVLAAAGGRIGLIVLTHRHLDHSAGAPELARRADCPVRAADPGQRIGPDGLTEGDVIGVGDSQLTVWATPGHTSDSCSLLLGGTDGTIRLLTGDTVLGTGTTVIAAPDGDLGAYLASLERLAAEVDARGISELLPGHGPVRTDPGAVLAFYRDHRRERLEQVQAAVAAGAATPAAVVARVYADLDASLWPSAEQSVRAQLDYLARRG